MKAVVIGSGFGGLAIGLRLLAKGYQVTILESRPKPGGRAYQLKDRGYTFDMGPSLITAPRLFDELFELFGKRREDYVSFVPLDPFYRIYFEKKNSTHESVPFEVINYNGNERDMMMEMEKLEPGGGEGYRKFFAATKPIYEAAYKKYGHAAFSSLFDFIKIFPEMLRVGAVLPMAYFARRFFKSDFGMRTFSFHPLYIGTNPYVAPAALGFIPWLEREEGVWFAKGGMYSVVEALARLFVEQGGELKCGENVVKLKTQHTTLRNQKRSLSEVITNLQTYAADVVISNADVLKTYELIEDGGALVASRKQQLAKKSYSMSLFLLYFGLKRQYHDVLAHHTLILGKEYKKLLEEVFEQHVEPTTLSMYLHIPSVTDATMAPEGCESMYILVPVPHLSTTFTWTAEREQKLRDWVVDYLEHTFGLAGFEESIEVEHHMTPLHFRDELQSTYGAAFSTQLSLLQSVYFRQHNKADEYANLYFVGAGTHPGPGVPGVILTATTTASLLSDVEH